MRMRTPPTITYKITCPTLQTSHNPFQNLHVIHTISLPQFILFYPQRLPPKERFLYYPERQFGVFAILNYKQPIFTYLNLDNKQYILSPTHMPLPSCIAASDVCPRRIPTPSNHPSPRRSYRIHFPPQTLTCLFTGPDTSRKTGNFQILASTHSYNSSTRYTNYQQPSFGHKTSTYSPPFPTIKSNTTKPI